MNNQLVEMQKELTEKVGRRVAVMEQEGLALPKNYNYQNALKSAFFELDKTPNIENCTQASIANSLLNMITQGLSPAKTQCYFIAYGTELQMQRSYFGTIVSDGVHRHIGEGVLSGLVLIGGVGELGRAVPGLGPAPPGSALTAPGEYIPAGVYPHVPLLWPGYPP